MEIKLRIDGKEIIAKDGDTILNVARANDIFVPAICYLTRCSPTLACRLCIVQADGKQVYSCNTKVKKDMEIMVNTPLIEKERKAIMEVYDVNHPLQCGVCDKSGECELQNYTTYMKVDNQSYSIKDTHRKTFHWGVMNYDSSLCIVCERCVTVCKDMIGSNSLSTVKRGSEGIRKEYKESMPKDAYAMWNKLNKSLIGYDSSSCTSCGECIAVCPVGALVSHDFQYTSNAWELSKIPASNPHSSDCAFIYYEVKHKSISKHSENKIYRVTNEPHFSSLNGSGRFAYNFENRVQTRDEQAFKNAILSFKKAKNIKFNSYITNEEAFILQEISTKTGANLVNEDARLFKEFLEIYSSTSGKSLYNGTLKQVHTSNFVISIGAYLKSDLPNARYALNNSVTVNKGVALYFHPIQDKLMEKIGKKDRTTKFIYHNPMAEESILYYILYKFAKGLPQEIEEYIDSKKENRVKIVNKTLKESITKIVKDEQTNEEKEIKEFVSKQVEEEVTYEYISFIDDFIKDENFVEQIDFMLQKKDSFSLIVGEDIISHPNKDSLAKLCGLVEKYTDFKVLIIPPQTNTLGVSQICTLKKEQDGFTVGYNQKADFELSALGDGDIDIPALNQQEGTFLNIDKKVVPTNAALGYKGYTLNEIANKVLDRSIEYTIDYACMLPLEKGFLKIDFDDLANEFLNNQEENRGYELKIFDKEIKKDLNILSSDKMFLNKDEIYIYKANPINQFNEFTQKAHKSKNELKDGIFISQELFDNLKLESSSKLLIEANNTTLSLDVHIDEQLEGLIPYISTYQKNSPSNSLFNIYRFNKAKVKRV